MPLTENRPKPMVPVLGRPVIDYVKDAMVAAGLSEIIVTTGYQGEQLVSHVDSWNVPSRVNQEESPMGTAGSVNLLSDELTETFVVGSGDSVASFDVADLLESHRKSGAKVTMALWEVNDPTEFGIVGLSGENQGQIDSNLSEGFITKFKEKPTPGEAFSNLINAGLYIIEPEVMELVHLRVRNTIFPSNCSPIFCLVVGQCMQRQSTESGSMLVTHLNCTMHKWL